MICLVYYINVCWLILISIRFVLLIKIFRGFYLIYYYGEEIVIGII